jgi:hypothetical protein
MATYFTNICRTVTNGKTGAELSSVPLTGNPGPSSWPKLPKTLARTHHWPVLAPHHAYEVRIEYNLESDGQTWKQ